MPLPWNNLATDTFFGEPDSAYIAGYAPVNYTNPGTLNAAMKNAALCTWNNFSSLMVSRNGIGANVGVGGGGRVRAQCNTVAGNLPAPATWPVETGGQVFNTLYVGCNAGGTTGYQCLALYDASAPTLRLCIRNIGGSRTIVETMVNPSVTTLVNRWLDAGFIRLSATQHWVFFRLYDTDGVTLLAECNQLFWDDWPSCPGTLPTGSVFGLSGSWASYDQVSYFDTAYVGALATPEAYLFTASQSRAILYCTPPQGGTGPFTQQWYKKTGAGPFVAVPGGTSLVLSNDIVSGSYQYYCTVTDSLSVSANSNIVNVSTSTDVCILANGDSITEGIANGIYPAWSASIQETFRVNGKRAKVLNWAAVTTQTNYQEGLAALYGTWYTRIRPDVITGRMGTNDAGAGVSNPTLTTRLQNGIQLNAIPQGFKTLYLCEPWSGTGLAPRNANNAGYDAVFTALAAADPILVKWQGNAIRAATTIPPAVASDFVDPAPNELHPSYQGYINHITTPDYNFIIANLDPVTVTSVTIDQTPDPFPMLPLAVQVFTATVAGTGLYDPTVTWSIVSGGGVINAGTGQFTAPGVAGNTVVRATSNGDPTKFDDITVQVGTPPPPFWFMTTSRPQ